MSRPSTIFVTGATGRQGGAVAAALLKNGFKVRAVVRNDSPRTEELQRLGAELFRGDFDDIPSLQRAAKGADAAFVMSTPAAGAEAETRQSINVINAARAAGIEHIVYSSVAGADGNTGIPHFESKFQMEQYLRNSGLKFTIVGPVFFMENLLLPWAASALASGVYAVALPAARTLQQVAIADIAGFAVEIFRAPDTFAGQRIEIASDMQTGAEAAEILAKVLRRKITYRQIPLEELHKMRREAAIMFEWIDRVGYHADIEGLRRQFPNVGWHRFEDWASKQDWTHPPLG